MAYQPKSYRKFLATSVAAAVVATGVAPVAGFAAEGTKEFPDIANVKSWAGDAITYLVEKGAIEGDPSGKFNPNASLTRGQIAKILAIALDLEIDENAKTSFADAANHWSSPYIAAIQDQLDGVINGYTDGTFRPNNPITRQELAKIVVEAYGLELNEDADIYFSDNNGWGAEYVNILASLGIVEGKGGNRFQPNATVTRAEAAVFVHRTEVEDVRKEVKEKENKETGLSIVEGQVFDDDTEEQFVKIKLDGKEVTAAELVTEGYNVKFEAFEKRNGVGNRDIFYDGSNTSTGTNTSTTGELHDNIDLGTDAYLDAYVRVTITKGSDVLVSPITKITIRNLDAAVSGISDGVLRVKSKGDYPSEFNSVSSTLVTGDEAKFVELVATVDGSKEVINLGTVGEKLFSVKSSDESVVSVDKSNYTLTAEGPGTATITVTYGGKTYTKTLTVKSEKRKIDTAKVNSTTVNTGVDVENTFKVQIIDQYGDPMEVEYKKDFFVESTNGKVATVDTVEIDKDPNPGLNYTVKVKGVDTGATDITIRNAAKTRIGPSVRVNVIKNTTVAKYTLAVDNSISGVDLAKIKEYFSDATKNNVSTTTTIDTSDKKYVKIDIKAFNSANQQLPPSLIKDQIETEVNASDAKVIDKDDIKVHYDDDGSYLFVKADSDSGTATITIKDKRNSSVRQSIKLTVTDKGVTVSNVSFKNIGTIDYATKLDYEDFLQYTSGGGDTRINGLTLTRSYSQAVRIAKDVGYETTMSNVDTLYIDINGDGSYTTGEDIVVGYTQMAVTGTVYEGGSKITSSVPASTGYTVEAGSDGTVIFRVYNTKEEIVATKAVKVDF